MDWALNEGIINEVQNNHLQKEIFGSWAIASVHVESHTSKTGAKLGRIKDIQ